MTDLTQPLAFSSGATMKNRFMLAPLTNCQSHADGTLSDDEYRWLTMRAEGGFGLTMTCAAHVQAIGQGSPASSASGMTSTSRASPAWPRVSRRTTASPWCSFTMQACARLW